MIRRSICIIAACLISAAFQFITALDLPIKNINGKPYYYYVVKKGDTVYSLVKRLGISRKDLVESNPSAADALKDGQILYFDATKFGDGNINTNDYTEIKAEIVKEEGYISHKVSKGETLYGLSKKYGVSPEAIIALNPQAQYGIKSGSTLRIPVAEQTDAEITAEPEEISEEKIEENDAPAVYAEDQDTVVSETEDPTDVADDTDDITVDNIDPTRPGTIAILLPFMLDSDNPGRQALLYTDYYKGFLLAADSLSNRGDSITIYACDTMNDIDRLKSLLAGEEVGNASVIIAPDDERQLAVIADAVNNRDTKVVNVFNFKDSLYLDHRQFVQVNTPHRVMYAKAIEAIKKLYPDYNPLILRHANGRNDKAEFVSVLDADYRSRGIEPVELMYDESLSPSQLEQLLSKDDDGKYLIIPTSGNIQEFNKFINAVITVTNSDDGRGRFAIFGYPDWTAFRGEAESLLYAVDATVYSRFYYDKDSFDTRSLNQAYGRWFDDDAIDALPNQVASGFDTGNWIIRSMHNNDGRFEPVGQRYEGVQSSFCCKKADGSVSPGSYNDEIYILRFTPERRVERMTF